jgi:hypothetical protein
MPGNEYFDLAERLAARLFADITLAKTREEHIRVTARANEASELLMLLTELKTATSGVEEEKPLYEFETVTFTPGGTN